MRPAETDSLDLDSHTLGNKGLLVFKEPDRDGTFETLHGLSQLFGSAGCSFLALSHPVFHLYG